MDMEISKTDANTIIRLLTSSARIAARLLRKAGREVPA